MLDQVARGALAEHGALVARSRRSRSASSHGRAAARASAIPPASDADDLHASSSARTPARTGYGRDRPGRVLLEGDLRSEASLFVGDLLAGHAARRATSSVPVVRLRGAGSSGTVMLCVSPGAILSIVASPSIGSSPPSNVDRHGCRSPRSRPGFRPARRLGSPRRARGDGGAGGERGVADAGPADHGRARGVRRVWPVSAPLIPASASATVVVSSHVCRDRTVARAGTGSPGRLALIPGPSSTARSRLARGGRGRRWPRKYLMSWTICVDRLLALLVAERGRRSRRRSPRVRRGAARRRARLVLGGLQLVGRVEALCAARRSSSACAAVGLDLGLEVELASGSRGRRGGRRSWSLSCCVSGNERVRSLT